MEHPGGLAQDWLGEPGASLVAIADWTGVRVDRCINVLKTARTRLGEDHQTGSGAARLIRAYIGGDPRIICAQ